MEIRVNKTAYEPNSLDGGWPKEKQVEAGGFASYLERLQGDKRRIRAESFKDHYSQATLFWNSQTDVEQDHIASAFGFELAKVGTPEIRTRVLANLVNVNRELASRVADQLGLTLPAAAKAEGKKHRNGKTVERSPALSIIANAPTDGSIKGRKIAILAADGVDATAVDDLKAALEDGGAVGLVLAPRLGKLKAGGGSVGADHTIVTEPSVEFDAVFVPGGIDSARSLAASGDAVHFVAEAYKHGKAIAAAGDGIELLREAGVVRADEDDTTVRAGLAFSDDAGAVIQPFLDAIAKHRAWDRTDRETVPA